MSSESPRSRNPLASAQCPGLQLPMDERVSQPAAWTTTFEVPRHAPPTPACSRSLNPRAANPILKKIKKYRMTTAKVYDWRSGALAEVQRAQGNDGQP